MRKSAVEGYFYDSDPSNLKKSIENCFKHSLGPGSIFKLNKSHEKSNDVFAAIIPHAGYAYSGPAAAHSYFEIAKSGFPETFIILSPNHTGYGYPISVSAEEAWKTPLGTVEVDLELAKEIVNECDNATFDNNAHVKEHSIEIHLPFLQYFEEDFKIVPIVLSINDIDSIKDLGNKIAKSIKKTGKNVKIIASTDLSHFLSEEDANIVDNIVIQDIVNMDEESLINNVLKYNISMCGHAPVAVTIHVSKLLGYNQSKILSYYTSGKITGDLSSVVGYTSAIII